MEIMKASTIRTLDAQAIALGIDGILLMEHAAMALLKHIDLYAQTHSVERICIVCGNGNNGGDGFALARLLQLDKRFKVVIICAHSLMDIQGDASTFAKIAHQLNIQWIQKKDKDVIREHLLSSDIIVDCIFGTGLNRIVDGWNKTLIEMIKQTKQAYILACDIPSGIDADTGIVHGIAIKADTTITFMYGKLGLYIQEGRAYSGDVKIVDITIPKQLLKQSPWFTILDDSIVYDKLSKRDQYGHKGTFGKGLIIGGQVGMSGAVVMAAHAALRCGIGTITTMTPKASQALLANQCFEMMCCTIPMKQEILDKDALRKQLKNYDVVAFGNGMGRSHLTQDILEVLWEGAIPCIFDGDALSYLQPFYGKTRNAITVLTPHPKEVSYILGINTNVHDKSLLERLEMLERGFKHTTIVMKDANTIISDTKRYLNICGNDGLATGGSGDVLCGMILGFLAQKVNPLNAACTAVYIHGKCAESLAQHMSTYAILPRDILSEIASVILKIQKKK